MDVDPILFPARLTSGGAWFGNVVLLPCPLRVVGPVGAPRTLPPAILPPARRGRPDAPRFSAVRGIDIGIVPALPFVALGTTLPFPTTTAVFALLFPAVPVDILVPGLARGTSSSSSSSSSEETSVDSSDVSLSTSG